MEYTSNATFGSHQPLGNGDRKASRQVRSNGSRREKARWNPICSVARRVPLRTQSSTAQADRLATAPGAVHTLPVCVTGQGTPNNGCPEAVSASRALRAHSESCLRPRPRDCTPPMDLHLCANKSADSRLRQLVAWLPTHSQTGKYSIARGHKTSLPLTERPPHSRAGIPPPRSGGIRGSRRE